MLIVCPHCATSYELKTTSLGEGRSVRCTRCQTVWFATGREPALESAGMADVAGAGGQDEAATAAETEFHGDTAEFSTIADNPAETDPAGAGQTAYDGAAGTDFVGDAPPLAPGEHHEAGFAPGEGPFPITGGDVDAYVRRRASKRAKQKRSLPGFPKLKWPLAPLPTLLLGLSAATVFLVGWRTDVVRLLPQTASLYSTMGLGVNLRGLVFENIKTSRETHDGIPVMVVEGEIVSVSRKAVDVPRIRFGVRNGLGAEIYNWTAMPSRTIAPPGETIPFRSRLASPPAETHDITVRFYNRRDAAAPARQQRQ